MPHEEQTSAEAASPSDIDSLRLSGILDRPDGWAVFFDIDGTLIDLAETPDAIVVPPSLPADLQALSGRFGNALALVTGRGIPYVDTLFSVFQFPVAGLHGAERRDADGTVSRPEVTSEWDSIKDSLKALTAKWNGVIIEDKGAAVAAHYRLAPERQGSLEALMQRYQIEAGPNWTLQPGKMVIELRPASADKGHAVQSFLSKPPFLGRRPLAVGDDTTDEAMFRVANASGGLSVRVGNLSTSSAARTTISSPAFLRDLIKRTVS